MFAQSLAFSRTAVDNGEIWRLATASLAHLSWVHLAGNLLVFAAAVVLLRRTATPGAVVAVLAACALASTLGIYLGSTLDWYVGASGGLCGLLAWGASRLPMPTGPWLLGLLTLNVAMDQGRTLSWLGEPLAPQAHYWGLACGLALAVMSAWRASAAAPCVARAEAPVAGSPESSGGGSAGTPGAASFSAARISAT
jgi:rhomboid family GlyGly-CTERM serine protease